MKVAVTATSFNWLEDESSSSHVVFAHLSEAGFVFITDLKICYIITYVYGLVLLFVNFSRDFLIGL